jgi:hypothetical protein
MQLTGGFTQNIVMRQGDFVDKIGKTASDEVAWYASYLDKNDIPNIVSSNELGFKMEFLESKGPVNIEKVIEIVEKYKHYEPINWLTFQFYRDRIRFHVEQSPISNGDKLLKLLEDFSVDFSFAHGDLSIRNIIQTETGPKLIDPLYYRNFGSYIVDYAKLAFTLKFFNGDVEGFERVKRQANFEQFDILVASECVRVATYNRKFDFIAENLVNEL